MHAGDQKLAWGVLAIDVMPYLIRVPCYYEMRYCLSSLVVNRRVLVRTWLNKKSPHNSNKILNKSSHITYRIGFHVHDSLHQLISSISLQL